MTARPRLQCASLLLIFFVTSAEARWWKVQTSGIDANLRAVSAVYVPDPKAQNAPVAVVWASGSNGVILKSVDAGETWQQLHVPDGAALDFRGIVALNASIAYVMSIGEGEKSRIYKTTDGGQTWNLQFTGNRKEVFLDSIVCTSDQHCLALGDPINGRFFLLGTNDGEHWGQLAFYQMPASLAGEGAFAASNSSLILHDGEIFFVTGGSAARVFHSKNSGKTWTAFNTPITHSSSSSGIFSIAWLGGTKPSAFIIVGGDYQQPQQVSAVAAFSADNGKSWRISKRQPAGFRSAVASLGGRMLVAVGPSGEDISEDGGVHWNQTDTLNLNALTVLDTENGWAVGANGTVARLIPHPN